MTRAYIWLLVAATACTVSKEELALETIDETPEEVEWGLSSEGEAELFAAIDNSVAKTDTILSNEKFTENGIPGRRIRYQSDIGELTTEWLFDKNNGKPLLFRGAIRDQFGERMDVVMTVPGTIGGIGSDFGVLAEVSLYDVANQFVHSEALPGNSYPFPLPPNCGLSCAAWNYVKGWASAPVSSVQTIVSSIAHIASHPNEWGEMFSDGVTAAGRCLGNAQSCLSQIPEGAANAVTTCLQTVNPLNATITPKDRGRQAFVCGASIAGVTAGVRFAISAARSFWTRTILRRAMEAGGGCFAEGTSVLTARGEVAINDLSLGENVMAMRDGEGLPWQPAPLSADLSSWIQFSFVAEDGARFDLLRPQGWQPSLEVGSTTTLMIPEWSVVLPAMLVAKHPVGHRVADEGPRVLGKSRRFVHDVFTLELGNGESLVATREHPIYSLTRESFVPVSQLRQGERLATARGEVEVASLRPSSQGQWVYNIQVEDAHTYLVGSSQVVAHNSYFAQGEFRRMAQEWKATETGSHIKGETLWKLPRKIRRTLPGEPQYIARDLDEHGSNGLASKQMKGWIQTGSQWTRLTLAMDALGEWKIIRQIVTDSPLSGGEPFIEPTQPSGTNFRPYPAYSTGEDWLWDFQNWQNKAHYNGQPLWVPTGAIMTVIGEPNVDASNGRPYYPVIWGDTKGWFLGDILFGQSNACQSHVQCGPGWGCDGGACLPASTTPVTPPKTPPYNGHTNQQTDFWDYDTDTYLWDIGAGAVLRVWGNPVGGWAPVYFGNNKGWVRDIHIAPGGACSHSDFCGPGWYCEASVCLPAPEIPQPALEPLPGEGETCGVAGEFSGVCQNEAKACDGVLRESMCPGPAAVKCCGHFAEPL